MTIRRSLLSSVARDFNRCPYSTALSGSWIEHGPTMTRRRSSLWERISWIARRAVRTVFNDWGDYTCQLTDCMETKERENVWKRNWTWRLGFGDIPWGFPLEWEQGESLGRSRTIEYLQLRCHRSLLLLRWRQTSSLGNCYNGRYRRHKQRMISAKATTVEKWTSVRVEKRFWRSSAFKPDESHLIFGHTAFLPIQSATWNSNSRSEMNPKIVCIFIPWLQDRM
jgi:hypothetical protein